MSPILLDRVRNMFHKKQKVSNKRRTLSKPAPFKKIAISEESLDRVAIAQESDPRRVIKSLRSRLRHPLGRNTKGSEPAPLDSRSPSTEKALGVASGTASASAAPDLDEQTTDAEAVEASSPTASIGADIPSSQEDHASSESGEDGQVIDSTVVGTPHHVTRHRSAPALIQDGPSPAKSAISDATLLNSPRRASPFSPRTPFRIVDADDDYVITSSSSRQDLSSTVWGTNRDGDISRYRELVEQLQADLATERENALHDRGVARQALGEAEDDIADLKAEVLDIKDELVNEKQNCQNSLDDYYRCDRDATIIITECHERIAKLEANLYLEQRKARHNYAKAEEYMGLAQSWQDAFHQLGHDPDALWKMLVEELKVRGIVFDYCGHLHRVGLRKTILDAEDADQWVAGLDDRSLLTQEASERTDRENTTDAMTQPGDTFAREQFEGDVSEETNRGQSQVTAEGKTAGEKQADGKANEEHVTNKDRHIDLKDIVDANRMDEQTQNCTRSQPCGTEPLIDVNTEEAVPHDQRHGVSQGNDIRNLVVRDREEISSLEVEDEADIENVTSNCGLADDVSDDTQLTDCVRQQNKPDGADGHEIAPRIPSVKDCEMEAVNWSSNRKAASWETPSRLLNPQISFLGLRHSLALPTMGNGFLRPLLWSHRGIEVRT